MAKVIIGQGNGWFIKTKLTLLLVAMIMPIAGWGWGGGDPSSLAGQWVPSEASSAPSGFPDDLELLKDGTGLGEGRGFKWSAENGRLIFRADSGQARAYSYQISGSTLILSDDNGQSVKYMPPEKAKAARKAAAEEAERSAAEAEAARKAAEEATRKAVEVEAQKAAKTAGFIAIAPDGMTWNEAKSFCASKGGLLPLIGGKNSDDFYNAIDEGTPIDGFGSVGTKWPSGLPDVNYWTGTKYVGSVISTTGEILTVTVKNNNGHSQDTVGVSTASDKDTRVRVVCVPEAARKTEEEAAKEYDKRRSEEEAKKEATNNAAKEKFVAGLIAAEKLAKAAGFIAVAPSLMNWSDAKAYCTSKGGRLPLIKGSTRLPYSVLKPERPDLIPGIPIDGFGSTPAQWPSFLPKGGSFWTGTENAEDAEKTVSLTVFDATWPSPGVVDVGRAYKKDGLGVVCVP